MGGIKYTILAFGVAGDIFSSRYVTVEMEEHPSVRDLRTFLEMQRPQLKSTGNYMIAVNNEYAEDDLLLSPGDEIAIIPPVSGG